MCWPVRVVCLLPVFPTEGGHVVRYYNMHDHSGPGLPGPLNLAVKALAPSDWVAYLMDHAEWTPDHLSSLVSAALNRWWGWGGWGGGGGEEFPGVMIRGCGRSCH